MQSANLCFMLFDSRKRVHSNWREKRRILDFRRRLVALTLTYIQSMLAEFNSNDRTPVRRQGDSRPKWSRDRRPVQNPGNGSWWGG